MVLTHKESFHKCYLVRMLLPEKDRQTLCLRIYMRALCY